LVVAIGNDGAVLRQLDRLFNVGTCQELTDGQLLERFATDRDLAAEQAFAILLERHGPMVLRVCRGVLDDPHDAQDAFQATFLVLVRKARALWVRDSLGPWLHQVAYRTASCARSAIARRRRHERRAAKKEEVVHAEPALELERLLHHEIDRLPERYRAPVVLCDLEGRSHEQAARHLGWPVGTVKSRLSRGRERLRNRLLKSGISPDAGLIATALSFDGQTTSIPAALVHSTCNAATRFLAAQTVVQGAAALLAQGVLESMFVNQWLKTGSIMLVVGAAVAGVGLFAQTRTSGTQPHSDETSKAAAATDAPDFVVKAGKLTVVLFEKGSLESSNSADFYCDIEEGTKIIRIVPEGTRVKKGDVIGELDATSLRDHLVNQQVTTGNANAAYESSKLAREVAELAMNEYVDGTFKRDLNRLKSEVRAARSAIMRTESRLERTRRARERLNAPTPGNGGTKTRDDIVSELDLDDRVDDAEKTLTRERIAFELAKSKLELLEKYSLEKTTKALQMDVVTKQAEELTKRTTWEHERAKDAKLERQIAACTLIAPIDGLVVYGNERDIYPDLAEIETGGTVSHRRKIVTIVDLSQIQVFTYIAESRVHQLSPKMTAKVRVDAFPDEVLSGTVRDVAPRPDRAAFVNSDVKVYPTHIQIDDPIQGLRPGMTVGAEILIKELDNVLSVPIAAVLSYDGKYHMGADGKDRVAVKRPGWGFEWRDVELGIANDKQVEVKDGLKSGEAVIINPASLMSEEERNEMFGAPPRVPPPAGSTPAVKRARKAKAAGGIPPGR
jgi:HlyD family secretion protein